MIDQESVTTFRAALVVAILGLAVSASGITFYVDGASATSADGNNGLSWATAKKTIDQAYEDIDGAGGADGAHLILVRGDHVYRERADLDEVAGTSDTARIVFRGVPGTNDGIYPVVSGADVETGWTLSGGYDKTYQTAAAATIYNCWEGPKDADDYGDAWDIYLEMGSVAEVEATTGSFHYAANVLYVHTSDNSHPTNFQIDITVGRQACMRVYVPYVTIENFKMRHSSSDGVLFEDGTNSIVRNCRIYQNGDANGDCALDVSARSPNVHIENCTIYSNAWGLRLSGAQYAMITGCTMYLNDHPALGTGYGCYMYAEDCTFAGNTIYRHDRAIFLNNADRATFYNNTFYRNGVCLYFYEGSSFGEVYNNSFYDDTTAIWLSRGTSDGCTNTIIFNNIAWVRDSGYAIRAYDDESEVGVQSDYNCLYATDGAFVGAWDGDRDTLANWQGASSQDAHSMSTNPVFVDIGAALNDVPKDLHLQDSSPCIDAGTNLFALISTPASDIDGDSRPLHSGYDMGSDEVLPKGTVILIQ